MKTPTWTSALNYDPLPLLLSSNNEAITYFVARDLFGKKGNPEEVWEMPVARNIVKRQQDDGSWKYSGGTTNVRSAENYNQMETYRQLGFLVEMFAFNKEHPAIPPAADFLFSFQTDEGDIRGILGNQYCTHYSGAILELLIKAGYEDDPRTIKAMEWFKSSRQDDGGWALPFRTRGRNLDILSENSELLQPDLTQPFSHLVTGMVLRAFAAHKQYRKSPEAQKAGLLLASHIFSKDNYLDRSPADVWRKFTFPFWFTDVVSAMDSLTLLGFTTKVRRVQRALKWLVNNQSPDGLWKLRVVKNSGVDTELWLTLAVSRILKRLG